MDCCKIMFSAAAVAVAAVSTSAFADVVYDAGAALRENCSSGAYANPYTDANGGKWEYLRTSSPVLANEKRFTSSHVDATLPGVGGDSAPYIRVNASGSNQGAGLDYVDSSVDIYDVVPGLRETDPLVEQTIAPNELVVHPSARRKTYDQQAFVAVRFIAPEDGWYSADATARDLKKQIALAKTNESGVVEYTYIGAFSGVQVTVLAAGTQLFQQIVSLEDYATNTSYVANGCVKSADFHVPATKLLKNQTIEIVVGNRGEAEEDDPYNSYEHFSDATGVKLSVTKHDRIVYDGGKALRQNCASGAYVGTDGSAYTDELGGQWKYLKADTSSIGALTAFGASYQTGSYAGIGGSSSPWIRVNVSGSPVQEAGEPIEADELYIHPSGGSYSVLQFVVPEDGWYSAFMSAHDVSLQAAPDANSGAEVMLMVNTNMQAKGVVSLEDFAGTDASDLLTHRFDFQMPARWMSAGETIEFAVGPNAVGPNGSEHYNDATGMKAYVVREGEVGTFYDSGVAMKNNVALGDDRTNPYGTVADGTWYCLDAHAPYFVGNPYGMTDELWASWAPTGFLRSASLLAKATRASFGDQLGFAATASGTSPFVFVNASSENLSQVAPGELFAHPGIVRPNTGDRSTWTNKWTTLRFRPPASGWYSGSVVARDVAKGSNSSTDGVRVYLNVGDRPVTNALVKAEAFTSTAHLTFDSRLLVAGEPVDVVVATLDTNDSDGTAVSAIFRRERDVCDAGRSFFGNFTDEGKTGAKPFDDVLGGMKWNVGSVTYATNSGSFATLPYYNYSVDGGTLGWRGYTTSTSGNGGLPRVMVATNGVAGTDNNFVTGGSLFGTIPCEMWAHPNAGAVSNRSAAVRATVQDDGLYAVRAYGRDLVKGTDSAAMDGVRVSVGVGGNVPATVELARESDSALWEGALAAERLWLRAGSSVDVVVEPKGNNNSDGTGLSACLVGEGYTPGSELGVVNVDFCGSGSGKFSGFDMPGREGWAEWRSWNALRPGASSRAAYSGCYDADGTTRRNVNVAVERESGSAVSVGTASSGNALLDGYVKSTGAGDEYAFTVSRLKANEPYRLYLYSAKGAGAGNAVFAVGDVEKSPDETWFVGYGGVNDVAGFDVVSDANGVVSGTFRAASSAGAAFNGLTLVGALDGYKLAGMMIIFQ